MTTDEQRLDELARTHGPKVLGYLARRVSPREDAADLFQQTLITAWRKIAAVPDRDDEALAWLLAVARGELANHHRAGQRRSAAAQRLRDLLATSPHPSSAGAVDLVHDALADLDPLDREIVTLTYWEGLTSDQVATVIGSRPATVRKRLQRTRFRLAVTLGATTDGRAGPPAVVGV